LKSRYKLSKLAFNILQATYYELEDAGFQLKGEKMSDEITFGENSRIEGEEAKLGKSIRIGSNAVIKGRQICIEDKVVVGENTVIYAEHVFIGSGAKIEENCEILAKEFSMGWNSHIEKECNFMAIRGRPAEMIVIGDGTFIGSKANVLVPVLKIGDYTTIHNNILINGYEPCIIGHNCYIGQYAVLNSTKKLTIGNNVGIALFGQIWTHAAFGELLEGCNIFKEAPTVIEDDVWLMGGHISVSPGLTLGKKSVILVGSIVTKDTIPGHCYGGIPAQDITKKIKPYREVAVDEKYNMMKKFIDEFVQNISRDYKAEKIYEGYLLVAKKYKFKILFLEEVKGKVGDEGFDTIIITKHQDDVATEDRVTVFDLQTKCYTKKRTDAEFMLIAFLKPYRARFLPKD
jgi:acetyltransferase-like isoleucine patch superfamily enzyme